MVILEIILENNSTQNYLVVQPKDRYFKRVAGVGSCEYIYFGIIKVCLMKELFLLLYLLLHYSIIKGLF